MLSGKFQCPICNELFDRKVWHCPKCAHHWLLEDTTCKNCYYELSEPSALKLNPPPTLAEGLKIDDPVAMLPQGQKEERKTRESVAAVAHVSGRQIDKVKLIQDKATPEQIATLVKGSANPDAGSNGVTGLAAV